jgi:rod shape-determining protein MreC
MVAIPSRHKSFALLIGVLLAQILMLAVQIKRDSRGRLIRVWAVSAVSPFARGGASVFDRIGGVWHHYFALSDTARQNEALRAENDQLKIAIAELNSKAAEADRLSKLLAFRDAHERAPMVAARVIGASAGTVSRTIEIDRGERDGIRRNMPVITPDGAVGKVIETYRDTSQILLLTDRDSGAGAMLVPLRQQGAIGGTGDPSLVMKYVAADDTVNVGDKIVTSGMDKIFPRDIPIGTVTAAESKLGNPFKIIKVQPAARLDRLEEVLVLLSQQPLEFPKDAADTQNPNTPRPAAGAAPSANNATPAAPVHP